MLVMNIQVSNCQSRYRIGTKLGGIDTLIQTLKLIESSY
jgi:hypothetical protein